MTPDQLLDHLRQRPFLPFRVHMTDGKKYDVRHPEMALVSRLGMVIATGPSKDDVPERLVFCDPLHIIRVVPLANGKAKGKGKRKGGK